MLIRYEHAGEIDASKGGEEVIVAIKVEWQKVDFIL